MTHIEQFNGPELPADFYWLNPPDRFSTGRGLEIWTRPESDFWQRTHYGFRNDNGHCLLKNIDGDFALTIRVSFQPAGSYDQCGLFIRIDPENWIKASSEYFDEKNSKLGSVVTNLGYSDWSTQDISSQVTELWYRASRRGADVKIDASLDGKTWQMLRICHLHQAPDTLAAGVYACSPRQNSFRARFISLEIAPNTWQIGDH